MVNIGVHYVAAAGNGQPVDTDTDGVPDYLEDANGNGVYDPATESDWRTAETNGVYFLGLTNGMVLSGVVNLPVEMYGVGHRSGCRHDPVCWWSTVDWRRRPKQLYPVVELASNLEHPYDVEWRLHHLAGSRLCDG